MGLNTVRNQDIIFLLLKVKILSDKLKKQNMSTQHFSFYYAVMLTVC